MLTRILTLAVAVATSLFSAASAQEAAPLAAGQEWSIQGEGLDSVRVVIGHLETAGGLGDVAHISVSGIPPEYTPGGVIGHLPYQASALPAFLDRQTGTGEVAPEFENGMAHWREARGGAFDISLEELITVLLPASYPTDPPK
ncbi:MAG: hypothetical protein NPIRA05_23340 [Nitrospirales bacterium]|nr:MAG: hypothetical protein NPIRA05_23340 [Nitrospirales bacterium]GJM42155.1 MAG: hypothetical protein DHS20C20_24370 [Ardenticatenaceae bacterium]